MARETRRARSAVDKLTVTERGSGKQPLLMPKNINTSIWL